MVSTCIAFVYWQWHTVALAVVILFFPKIAEEVGELEIRCRFGCRARETSGDPGAGLEYEADLQGVKTSCSHVCTHCSLEFALCMWI